jgi:CheY-like chemotaxis protein
MTVLVADDSAVMRSMAGTCVKRLGLLYAEAQDGEEAWSKLQAASFNLLITDLNMPRLNGLELVARIRAHGRLQKLPVLMVTTETNRQRGLDAGASVYLVKPFQPKDMLQAIRQLLPSLGPA